MDFSFFDIVIFGLILFLGLKGIINGFFKELFGFIGIVGGIFIASRAGNAIGEAFNSLFHFQNSTTMHLAGFVIVLALFWGAMVFTGLTFKNLSRVSGLGIFDKLLGFFFSAGKFFFVISVIAYSFHNIKAIGVKLDNSMSGSFLFPLLVDTGSFVMKLEPPKELLDSNQTEVK